MTLQNTTHNHLENFDKVLKHVAMEILLEMIVGKSTKLYEEMYNEGLVTKEFGIDYSFEEDYVTVRN